MALVQRYGSIDLLYAAMPEIEMAAGTPAKPGVVKKLAEGEEMARMSYDLATIRTDAPIEFTPEQTCAGSRTGPPCTSSSSGWSLPSSSINTDSPPPRERGIQRRPRSPEPVRARWWRAGRGWRSCLPGGGAGPGGCAGSAGLDTVCVEWQESESLSRAALFFAGRLDCHNQFLRVALRPRHSARRPMGRRSFGKPCWTRGSSPGTFIFDTEVAAYLLALLTQLRAGEAGDDLLQPRVPQAAAYLEEGAFGPLADPAAPPPPCCPTPPSSGPCGRPSPSGWRSWG